MERDAEARTVEAPPELKKELAKSKTARERWEELAFTHKKEMANSISRRQAGGDEEAAAGEGDAGVEDGSEVDGITRLAQTFLNDPGIQRPRPLAKSARRVEQPLSLGIAKLLHDLGDVVFLERRMAAMPEAPASRQEWAFDRVIPPRARTGMFALQACLGQASPAGLARLSFRRQGRRRRRLRLVGCGLGYFFWRVAGDCDQRVLVVSLRGRGRPRHVHSATPFLSTSCGEMSSERRWTPSA